MTQGTPTSNRVVDLLRYKAARSATTPDPVSQPTLDFDAESGGSAGAPAFHPRRVFALVTPFRPLSSREIAHREQMMRHLTRGR